MLYLDITHDEKSKNKFLVDADINLTSKHQIMLIKETCEENLFLLVAKDLEDLTMIIVTWDMSKNIEYQMFQRRFEQ